MDASLLVANESAEQGTFFSDSPPIDWCLQTPLTELLQQYPPNISELTFTNLYVWRNVYPRRWAWVDGHFVCGFLDSESGQWVFLQPVGPNPAEVMRKLTKLGAVTWHRVDRELAEQVADELCVVDDFEESDYVYDRVKLVALEGPDYREVRRHVRQGERANPVVEPFSAERVPDCEQVVRAWLETKRDSGPIEERDAATTFEILRVADRLPLNGVVVYVGGKPEAFVLGEQHSDCVFVSHFEKWNLQIQGLAQFTFHAWVSRLPDCCRYVNREQAQGNPGLTRAKLAWRPSHFVQKCRVRTH